MDYREARVEGIPLAPHLSKPRAALNGRGPVCAAPVFGGERPLVNVNGVLMSVTRDRLEIAPGTEEADEFPVDVLPLVAREAVRALAHHVQAPLGLCAHSVLGAIALAAQGLVNVSVPALPSPRPLSLFMLAIAESGERKSACDTVALAAVSAFENELREGQGDRERIYKAEKAAYDTEIRKIQGDKDLNMSTRALALANVVEPSPPLVPIVRQREPTFEGLCNVLLNGRASCGVFTSEGGTFLGGHGLTDDNKLRTFTGLSELWDNGCSQRIRAKEITVITNRRVSVSLAAQERVVAPLLGDAMASEQGFLARFLIMMPTSTIGMRVIRASEPSDDDRLRAFNDRVAGLLDLALPLRRGTRNELDLPAISLDDDAWQLWQEVAQTFEDGCKADGEWRSVKPAALKMAENMARIAASLAVFERGAYDNTVTGENMAAAAAIGLFYLCEARRLSGHRLVDPETRALDALAKWLTDDWGDPLISPADIQAMAPRACRGCGDVIQRRVKALLSYGILESRGAGMVKGVKRRETYFIHGKGSGE